MEPPPEEPAITTTAAALTQADCPPSTLLNPDSQACAPVRDRRAELAPGSGKRKPPDLRGLRAAKGGGPGRRPGNGSTTAGDMPVPGGLGVGVSYKSGELVAHDSGSLYTHMTIYPDGIGNLNSFLFSTATNRVQKGVEVVGIYLTAGNHDIGIFDWSCSAASPCLSEGNPVMEPAWIWVRPFRDNECWFANLDNGNGQLRNSMYYNNATVRAGGAWRNTVSFWNYCNSTWDLMYLHDYAGEQEDCSVTGGCAWWGPILETFFPDDWNRPIPDLGFFGSQLIHDGVTSTFPPTETDFNEPQRMWNVCYRPSNATWGAGSGASCPTASLNFSSSAQASQFTTQGGTWGVSSGAYRITTATSNSSVHLNNRAVHNKYMQADFTLSASASVTASSSTSDNFALIFGWQDASNYYYADFAESNSSSQSGIFRVQGGTQTQLTDITSLITAGTTYNVKVEREGSAIRVYRNGSLVASADDSTFLFGQTGVGTKNDRATFDNFVLTMAQINEHFEAESFMVPFEGTWEMLGSGYELTMPLTYSTTHLNNRSLQDWSIYGNFVATTDARAYPTTGVWDDFAVIFGWQDWDNYYFASFNESNNGTTKGIFKVVGGVSTQLADITTAFTAGTTYKIKIERTGSSIKVYRDGTLQATATDSTFPHGRIGYGSASSAARFDNLVVY